MKCCSKCGESKPFDEFYREKGAPDGRRGDCKACILLARAMRYESDPKMRERLIASAMGRYESQVGPLVPRNCSRCGLSMRRSRTGNPGACSACKRLAGYTVDVTRAERLGIYERDGWVCQICTDPVDPDLPPNDTWSATLDHITPRSAGGDDSPSNLRLAHRWCNSVRGDLSHYTDDDLRIA